ncbi:hypothetical protein [Halobacillus salinus]|uniref:DUF3221 domain-containing protein n=1 Tax=Halobacillus salinus TaxID=192814 RepID=A0A4Z0H4R9_9BACI|nr:hypothetical protein [Halobacillus salinus]TGB04914.1 hypothetical protein E4663_07950 [Halobacillus salinus]
MKWQMLLFLFVLTGCMNQTSTLEGEALVMEDATQAFVLNMGDILSEEEKENGNYDKNDKVIEAARIIPGDQLEVSGEIKQLEDLQSLHKVEVVVEGTYHQELVSIETYFNDRESLPSYKAESIKVVPYTKEEVVRRITADQGEHSLHVYNPDEEADEIGAYRDIFGDAPIRSTTIESSFTNGVLNRAEHFKIAEDRPTYIVTDDEGIVFHTHELEALKTYFDNWGKR